MCWMNISGSSDEIEPSAEAYLWEFNLFNLNFREYQFFLI